MLRALVTGSRGFAGKHLCQLLSDRGWTVFGLGTSDGRSGTEEEFYQRDLADAHGIQDAVRRACPDVVFHLAARTGRGSPREQGRTIEANVSGTLNLFSALRLAESPVRVIVVGSSAQYGAVLSGELPITERTACHPVGLYGWSKLAAEAIGMTFHGQSGLEVIAARPFNHTGPGESETMVASAFARQAAEIEAGAEPVLRVGNLESVRDVSDVRDIVRGYVALAERGHGGQVYNLCSGRGTRIAEMLDCLLKLVGVPVEIVSDRERVQRVDVPVQVGSFERAHRETGWSPEIPLERTMKDLLDTWRRQFGGAG